MRPARAAFKSIETRYRLFSSESILGITCIMLSVPLKVSSSVPKPTHIIDLPKVLVKTILNFQIADQFHISISPAQAYWWINPFVISLLKCSFLWIAIVLLITLTPDKMPSWRLLCHLGYANYQSCPKLLLGQPLARILLQHVWPFEYQ